MTAVPEGPVDAETVAYVSEFVDDEHAVERMFARPTRPVIRDEVVRLSDIATAVPRISDSLFINCLIVGPAVVNLQQSDLVNCIYDGPFQEIYWEVDPSERPTVVGTIALINTRLLGCRFMGVGIAGNREFGQQLRALFEGN